MLATTVLGMDWYIALAVLLVVVLVVVLAISGALGFRAGGGPRTGR